MSQNSQNGTKTGTGTLLRQEFVDASQLLLARFTKQQQRLGDRDHLMSVDIQKGTTCYNHSYFV